MKKILLIVITFVLLCPIVSADELDDAMDMWSADKSNDTTFTGQKMITDEQFDKTVDKIKQKERDNKRKKWWQRKAPEINPLCPVPETQNMFQSTELDNVKTTINLTPTIMIPTTVETSVGEIIEPGFYIMSYSKEGGTNYLNLSQTPRITYKIPAQNAQEEDNSNDLNYGKAINLDNGYIKLIYGNVDVNIEAYLHVKR